MKIVEISVVALTLMLLTRCSNGVDFKTSNTGLTYAIVEQIPSAKMGKIKDIYSLNVSILNQRGDEVFREYLMFERFNPVYPGDFHEALGMLHLGDSVILKLATDSFFMHHNMAKPKTLLESDKTVDMHVGVKNIQSPLEHMIFMAEAELVNMTEFVSRKNWHIAEDSNGIMYELTVHNPEGEKVQIGDSVSISYLYYTLNEQIIAKSKPNDYWDFMVGDQSRITGLTNVLKLMRKGERIRAVLPFTEAYGAEGFLGAGISILPYTTIIMEIHVNNVIKSGD